MDAKETSNSKPKKRHGLSYPASVLLIFALVCISCAAVYFGWLLHQQNLRQQSDLEEIKNAAIEVIAQGDTEVDGVNLFITLPEEFYSETEALTLSEALGIMQSQYDTNSSNLSMLLGVFTAGLALFGIAIPLFNYFFFQKEQVTQVQEALESAKAAIKVSGDALEEHKEKWNTELDSIKSELESQKTRLENAVMQSQAATAASMGSDVSNIVPISESVDDKASSYNLRAFILHNKRSYKEALVEFKEAVRLEPDNAQYHNNLGTTLHELKRYEEALAEKRKAVDLEPDNAQYCYNLGVTLHQLKRYEEAVAEKRKAVDLEPDKAQYCYSLGITLHDLKRYEEVLVELRKAVDLAPDNARYRDSLGVTLHDLKRYEEALVESKKAVDLEPDNAKYMYSYGATLYRVEQLELALRWTLQAIQKDENQSRAYIYRALTQISLNLRNGVLSCEAAFDDFSKGIALDPDEYRNYRDRAEAYLILNMLDEAEQDLKTAESKCVVADPQVYHLYAVLWDKRGDNEKAAQYHKQSRELGYIDEPPGSHNI